jgi:hypothetical protein
MCLAHDVPLARMTKLLIVDESPTALALIAAIKLFITDKKTHTSASRLRGGKTSRERYGEHGRTSK